jgi:hypothetical protein
MAVELDDTGLPAGGSPGTDQCGEMTFAAAVCQFSGGDVAADKVVCK